MNGKLIQLLIRLKEFVYDCIYGGSEELVPIRAFNIQLSQGFPLMAYELTDIVKQKFVGSLHGI